MAQLYHAVGSAATRSAVLATLSVNAPPCLPFGRVSIMTWSSSPPGNHLRRCPGSCTDTCSYFLVTRSSTNAVTSGSATGPLLSGRSSALFYKASHFVTVKQRYFDSAHASPRATARSGTATEKPSPRSLLPPRKLISLWPPRHRPNLTPPSRRVTRPPHPHRQPFPGLPGWMPITDNSDVIALVLWWTYSLNASACVSAQQGELPRMHGLLVVS